MGRHLGTIFGLFLVYFGSHVRFILGAIWSNFMATLELASFWVPFWVHFESYKKQMIAGFNFRIHCGSHFGTIWGFKWSPKWSPKFITISFCSFKTIPLGGPICGSIKIGSLVVCFVSQPSFFTITSAGHLVRRAIEKEPGLGSILAPF